ncbi:MAG TPA: uracil-DNA glycosylase [Burkholderiaceae bacterium]|nr:uracil-DNA glycosylase [Burkholderiaceae bacterium]
MALDLDRRQRAMLQEMNVRVWWPDAPLEVAVPTPAPAAEIAMPQTAGAPERQATASPRVVPQEAQQAPAVQVRRADVESMDWPALQDAVAGCQACKLCTSRKNTVFGVGHGPAGPALPPRVDWLVVGEAPGENEDIQGEPFVGQAGKLLDNMLRSIGLDRQGTSGAGVFITNVLKCRPPGNRNPEPDEIAQCEPFLKRQIELLQPRIILAVGRFAVQSLLQGSVPDVQSTPLGKLRGKVYRYHGVPVVVSYHPAYLLRSLPDKAKAWADLCLALDVMQKVSQAAPASSIPL